MNFQIQEGQLFHLKGANGVGKSTLLSILAGLKKAQRGILTYTYEQRSIKDTRPYFQYLGAESGGHYLELSAQDNLHFWAKLENLPGSHEEKIRESLKFWRLSGTVLERIPVKKYSTGMKKKLALARIHMLQKPFLLLDEPLNGLDVQSKEAFSEMLRAHLSSQGTAILVSHDTTFFEDRIDEVISL